VHKQFHEEKLWRCLEIAIRDFEEVSKNTADYRIDMGAWHTPYDGACSVCFAGAVMAGTCELPVAAHCHNGLFDAKSWQRFTALNYLRMGCIKAAVNVMEIDWPADRKTVHISPDNDFLEDMRSILAILKEYDV
jgi:hypothetical protein